MGLQMDSRVYQNFMLENKKRLGARETKSLHYLKWLFPFAIPKPVCSSYPCAFLPLQQGFLPRDSS